MDNNYNQQNYQNYQQPNYQQPNQYHSAQGYDFSGTMYGQGAMEEPKKKKTGLIVAIVLILLGLCCVGSCTAALLTGGFSFSTSSSSNNDLLKELEELDESGGKSNKKDKDDKKDDEDDSYYTNDDKDEYDDEDELSREEKDDVDYTSGNLSAHSKDLPVITIDGDEFEVGWTLGELRDMGYEIIIDEEYDDFDWETEITDAYFYESVELETSKGNIIRIKVENLKHENIYLEDTTVVGYVVEYYEYDDNTPSASLENGVVLNKTKVDEFLEEFPNPDYEYQSDYNDYCAYAYEVEVDDDIDVEYSYTFEDGVLVEIEISTYMYTY